ncbi:ionotropic receptor 21a isoform X2 [Cryptotermes secundus]|uniref:ionotropic receptor 21a isoform X2 n=1 Tax=Cryptotermes secundus TaxID=105785 RepID=UPI001454C769|nr:ionotropic receptor 21a isoform X2 [Cryptotermes secundus]
MFACIRKGNIFTCHFTVGVQKNTRHLNMRTNLMEDSLGTLQNSDIISTPKFVHREALHEQRREAGAGSSSEGVENEESLEPRALVGQLPNSVQHHIYQLLPDRVVATSVVVGGVLLPCDELLGVKQPAVGPRAHLVCNRSTNTARGTCLPAPVSLKKVLKLSSPPPRVLSEGICPSGWMPCSRQYSSQHALPIWTPAWPMCTEMHSLYVQEVFQQFWLAEVADVVAILPYRDIVRVFTIFPYRESCHLPGPPVLVDQLPWVDGAFPSVGLFPDIKVTSLHGCSLRFTTIDLAPDVILNLSLSDKFERWKDSVDGIEVRLVNTLASTMNFTVIISLPHDGYYWGWVHYNGSVSGMIADISNNLSDVGFGHVTHSTQDIGFLEYSASFARDCYGWGVPLGAGRQPPPWVAFTTEFSLLTWCLIVAALLLAAVVLWILPRVLPRWELQEKPLWGMPSSVMHYACGTLIMAPVWMKPRSQPVRIFAAFWLLYCIVVSVAYQAKMGSIVTVPWAPVNIHSLEELMESDLNLKAPWKLLKTLHKSDDDLVIRAIVARLQPVSTITELVDQLQSQKKQNFAYLMYRRSLMFYASQSGWKFHVMSEGCLMGHHTALVVRRGSLLIPRFNIIIQRLIDSGIVRKWACDFTPRRAKLESRSAGLTIQNMLGAFRVLVLGHLLAVITLLVEFCYSKLRSSLPDSHHLHFEQGDL